MTIEPFLKKLGLTKNETAIYLSLFELGEATGYQIAQTLSMKRPTVYSALDELRKKDLVKRIPRSNKFLYVAKDPRELVQETRELADDIERFVPQLLAMSGGGLKPKIIALDGPEAYEHATLTITKYLDPDHDLVGFYAYEKELTKEVEEISTQYLEKIAATHAPYRLITPDHIINKTYVRDLAKKYNFSIKHLPMEYYPARVSMDTAGHFTRIISRHDGQSLLIESHEIAQFVRHLFEMMWNCADFIGSEKYPGKEKQSK